MRHVVGTMSGSSLDGLDIALCTFDDSLEYRIVKAKTFSFPEALQNRLINPLDKTVKSYFEIERDFSFFTAESIIDFLKDVNADVELIVSHGHTIFHDPENNLSEQIGNGGVIAGRTRIDTLCDLRIQDIVLGGEGAPLASIADKYLFQQYALMLNLGGIANISVRQDGNKIEAWDIVPCNQGLNFLANRKGLPYDQDGAISAGGVLIPELVEKWEKLDFFHTRPPKSLDNSWVKSQFINELRTDKYSIADMMATVVHFVVKRIKEDIKHFGLPSGEKKLLLSGGGAHNVFLINTLKEALYHESIEVVKPEDKIIDYKEALLMAFMGELYLNGKVNTVCTATGAKKNIVAGGLYLGNG